MILADTDVLIDSLHGKEPSRGRIDVELSTGRLTTTSVTSFELLSGARTPAARRAVEDLLEALTVLPIDDEAARRAAEVRRDLESRGLPIGTPDYLIAGACLSRDAILLTRNRAHFERVKGLVLGSTPA